MNDDVAKLLGKAMGEVLQEVADERAIPVDGEAIMVQMLSNPVTDDEVRAALDQEWGQTFMAICEAVEVHPGYVGMAVRSALQYRALQDHIDPLFRARRECLVDDDPVLASARGLILGGGLGRSIGGLNTPLAFAAYVIMRRFDGRD